MIGAGAEKQPGGPSVHFSCGTLSSGPFLDSSLLVEPSWRIPGRATAMGGSAFGVSNRAASSAADDRLVAHVFIMTDGATLARGSVRTRTSMLHLFGLIETYSQAAYTSSN